MDARQKPEGTVWVLKTYRHNAMPGSIPISVRRIDTNADLLKTIMSMPESTKLTLDVEAR